MQDKIYNIIFLGPQGSGKGTQAELLAKKLALPRIETGEIFRQEISAGTELGKKIGDLINRGELVSDEITNKIIVQELKKEEYKNGVILDGYPRNLVQANALEQVLGITKVILVNISDQEAVERISSRRTCPICGKVYSMKYDPPVRNETCDKCSEKLIIRADDTKAAIEKRLEIYHRETEPVVYHYKQRGVLIEINGEQSVEKVEEDIVKKLGLHTNIH